MDFPIRHTLQAQARLAFAIATAFQPDILLMDEGIGAGDQFFLERVKKRANSFILGANILFSRRIPHAFEDVCNKALVLDGGRIIGAGDLEDMLDLYAGMKLSQVRLYLLI